MHQIAIEAAMNPLALTLTSVTVQIETPNRTTKMLSLVSLEYFTLSRTTSRKHETGIMLSFAIYIEKKKDIFQIYQYLEFRIILKYYIEQ